MPGRYVEQAGRLTVGEPAEHAQRKARALEPGELAHPHHDRRQQRRAGRLAGGLLGVPVHVANQAAPSLLGRHAANRAGEVGHREPHGLGSGHLVPEERARERVGRPPVAVPQVLELPPGDRTRGCALGLGARSGLDSSGLGLRGPPPPATATIGARADQIGCLCCAVPSPTVPLP